MGTLNLGSHRSQVGKNETNNQSSNGPRLNLAKVGGANPVGTTLPQGRTGGWALACRLPGMLTVLNASEFGCWDWLCWTVKPHLVLSRPECTRYR